MEIKEAVTEQDIRACYPCMKQLRKHLSENDFLNCVKQQQTEHYKLVYLKANNHIQAVMGYRILHNLAWGKFLYIDDLVTVESRRSQGYGSNLLSWAESIARENRCNEIHLDSGLEKTKAHQFYLTNHYTKKSMHFRKCLDDFRFLEV